MKKLYEVIVEKIDERDSWYSERHKIVGHKGNILLHESYDEHIGKIVWVDGIIYLPTTEWTQCFFRAVKIFLCPPKIDNNKNSILIGAFD